MKYIPTTGWEDGVAALSERLAVELAAGKRVLWLTSGGSNIGASVEIMNTLPAEHNGQLSVMPADERYGEPGHADSNWQQLMSGGFRAGNAKLLPALKKGLSFEQTAAHYQKQATKAFADNDVVIAQLGIGDDGHIAGILPDTVAADETDNLVVGYDHPSYRRLTLSFAGLRHINAAYAFAFGAPKAPALKALKEKQLPLAEQPSQILKELPEAYLYSDQLESTA